MSEQGSNQPGSEDAYEPQQSNKQVLIRMSDMEPQDQCAIVSIANSALEEVADLNGISQTQKFSKMAGIIKRQLDGKQGEGWYIICGKNFGTYVTHEQGAFIHFSFDEIHVCIFRAQ